MQGVLHVALLLVAASFAAAQVAGSGYSCEMPIELPYGFSDAGKGFIETTSSFSNSRYGYDFQMVNTAGQSIRCNPIWAPTASPANPITWFSFRSTGHRVMMSTCNTDRMSDGVVSDNSLNLYSDCADMYLDLADFQTQNGGNTNIDRVCYAFADSGCTTVAPYNVLAHMEMWLPAQQWFLAVRYESYAAGSGDFWNNLLLQKMYTDTACRATSGQIPLVPSPTVYAETFSGRVQTAMCRDIAVNPAFVPDTSYAGNWYRFTGTGQETLIHMCSPTLDFYAFDPIIDVYTECEDTSCGNRYATSDDAVANSQYPVVCDYNNHAPAVYTYPEFGREYYVYVSALNYNGNAPYGFDFSLYFVPGCPLSRTLDFANFIVENNDLYTDIAATIDSTLFYGRFTRSMWWAFTGTGSVVPIHTCDVVDVDLDTVIEVLESCSPTDSVLVWNDDAWQDMVDGDPDIFNPARIACSTNTKAASVFVPTVMGRTYFVTVHVANSFYEYDIVNNGLPFNLQYQSQCGSVNEIEAPSYNFYDVNYAFDSKTAEATQAFGYFGRGTWFYFYGPAINYDDYNNIPNEVVFITTCSENTDTDTVIEVFPDCIDTRFESRVGFNDEADGAEGAYCDESITHSAVFVPVNMNQMYHVYVHTAQMMDQDENIHTSFGSGCRNPWEVVLNPTPFVAYDIPAQEIAEATEAYNIVARGYWVTVQGTGKVIPIHTCHEDQTYSEWEMMPTVIEVFDNCLNTRLNSRVAWNDDADGIHGPLCKFYEGDATLSGMRQSAVYLPSHVVTLGPIPPPPPGVYPRDVNWNYFYYVFIHGEQHSMNDFIAYTIGSGCTLPNNWATPATPGYFMDNALAIDVMTVQAGNSYVIDESTEAYNVITRGIWYRFPATCDSNGVADVMPLYTCHEDYTELNSVIEVFDDSCQDTKLGSRLAWNGDADGTNGPLCSINSFSSATFLPTQCGQWYRTFVHGANNWDRENFNFMVGSSCRGNYQQINTFPTFNMQYDIDTILNIPEATEAYYRFSKGRWYTFTGTGHVVPIHTCTPPGLYFLNTVIEAFDTCHDTKEATRLAWNDNADYVYAPLCYDDELASGIFLPTIAGQEYHVFIHADDMIFNTGIFRASFGTGCLVAQDIGLPFVTYFTLDYYDTMVESTEAYYKYSRGAWYHFESKFGEVVPLHTCNEGTYPDTVIEVFDYQRDTVCRNTKTQYLVGSNDDVGEFGYEAAYCPYHESSSLVFQPTVQGHHYYVYVHGYDMLEYNNIMFQHGSRCYAPKDVVNVMPYNSDVDFYPLATTMSDAYIDTTECYGYFTRGYWFSFTGIGAEVVITSEQTNWHGVIELFDQCETSTCDARLTASTEEQTLCEESWVSTATYYTEEGKQYYFFLHGETEDDYGEFTLQVYKKSCREKKNEGRFGDLYEDQKLY